MTRHDDQLYFDQMLVLANQAIRLADGVDRQRYSTDEVLQLALTHLIQIIGEAAKKVSEAGRLSSPDVPWHEITGMRNRIVHDYIDVDADVVWEVVTGDLKPMIAQLERARSARPNTSSSGAEKK